jgi:hypothetical protein
MVACNLLAQHHDNTVDPDADQALTRYRDSLHHDLRTVHRQRSPGLSKKQLTKDIEENMRRSTTLLQGYDTTWPSAPTTPESDEKSSPDSDSSTTTTSPTNKNKQITTRHNTSHNTETRPTPKPATRTHSTSGEDDEHETTNYHDNTPTQTNEPEQPTHVTMRIPTATDNIPIKIRQQRSTEEIAEYIRQSHEKLLNAAIRRHTGNEIGDITYIEYIKDAFVTRYDNKHYTGDDYLDLFTAVIDLNATTDIEEIAFPPQAFIPINK